VYKKECCLFVKTGYRLIIRTFNNEKHVIAVPNNRTEGRVAMHIRFIVPQVSALAGAGILLT